MRRQRGMKELPQHDSEREGVGRAGDRVFSRVGPIVRDEFRGDVRARAYVKVESVLISTIVSFLLHHDRAYLGDPVELDQSSAWRRSPFRWEVLASHRRPPITPSRISWRRRHRSKGCSPA